MRLEALQHWALALMAAFVCGEFAAACSKAPHELVAGDAGSVRDVDDVDALPDASSPPSWAPLAPAKDGRPFAIPVTPLNVNGLDVPTDYVLVTTRRGANLWASPEAFRAYEAR
jgi:hypothetical protein